ncbi:MAG TPA: right-handed parallel beta-helix repeat-containing protein, partial [Bacteroidales bacterium]|nr:right-handed parallel beta-helix repeat-containing protein [Bacteroidales bacterium]
MIVFEPGTNDSINWLSAAQGFKLSSGTKIIMPPDYQLELEKAAVRTSGSYGFYAEADSNIVIEGGIIDGNSAALHPYFNEWDHAFAFWDCDNIVIRNVTIKNMPGDGIYINNCTNVWIENCYIEVVNKQIGGGGAAFIGRNPISVIRGENIYIRNNTTVGGLPGGIVFETNNSPHHHFKNVYIVNNTVLDSDCHGINVTVGFG